MNEHDISDNQWKVAVVLTVAMLGWLCFNSSGFTGAQRRVANLDLAPHATNAFASHASGPIVSGAIKDTVAISGEVSDNELDPNSPEEAVPDGAPVIKPRAD